MRSSARLRIATTTSWGYRPWHQKESWYIYIYIYIYIIVDDCPDDWIDAGEVPVKYTDDFEVRPTLLEAGECIRNFISQHCVMDPDNHGEWEAITPEEFLSFVHSAIHGAMDYGWRNGAVL